MSHTEAPAPEAADPSMEDILASIRRILNDGDGVSAEGAEEAPAPIEAGGGSDVFILDRSMMIEDRPPPVVAQEEVMEEYTTEPEPEPEPVRAPEPDDDFHPPPLLAPETASAASHAVGTLVRALHDRQMPVHRGGGPTLEDIVREEMRPLVKSWLDEHLPPLVERLVRAEIERLVGRAAA